MKITDIEACTDAESTTLSARVQPDGVEEARTLWFRYEGLSGPLEFAADAFVAALLPFCMYEGEACRVEGAISPTLRANLDAAQSVLAGWYDFLTPVEVFAEAEAPETGDTAAAAARGVACCFSGGVDSWYSLLKNRQEITHLLLVRGFDIGLENDVLWRTTRERLAGIAVEMNLRLVTCETNLRAVADKGRAGWGRSCGIDFWGQCLHGAALASVSLALSRSFGSLILPATHSKDQLKPWGSSPKLDPLWSNGQVRVRHDGCEAGRIEKVRAISVSDLALRSLRVCHNDLAEMNCGRCEKCVRTLLALRLCGALEKAETFPDTGALRKLRRMEVPAHLMHHYEALHAAALERGDGKLARQIEAILGQRFSTERALATCVRALKRGKLQRPRGQPGRRLVGHAQQG